MNFSTFFSKGLILAILISSLSLLATSLSGQKAKHSKGSDTKSDSVKIVKTGFDTLDLSGLKFRNLGPAITSGRIVDFAVDPKNHKRYFVASAAGGVWRTGNAGTTYEPVFDGEGSFSIGCVSIDPNTPSTVWVGTGENNNQRSVAYGDGVYKSVDGGSSWTNMGLKNSEHIGKVLIHPDNSNTIFVAAIGPLWGPGGDRGLYKSKDGGKTWNAVLTIDENTGVNDVVMDLTNHDILYASSFQRRRHVFTYLGGGPQSNIYKSTDGGETWVKSGQGLPAVDIGRIGFATSQADPTSIYAIVEAARGKGGTFRSNNQGASWEKMGDYSSAGNYYDEIVADPNHAGKLYSMDTWLQVSNDGGKSWKNLGEDTKHVDNHCMWIDPDDSDHFLVGCDGGIYESYDAAKTWLFKNNLPVVQFYRVALDNAEPFYNIYGGTQDNFSLGGPSRSISGNGIANDEWFITHGGDGFESQVDPNNPNIVYAESQYGGLVRYDKLSGEEVGIQPHERKNEDTYRWNWDAPLVASSHVPGRIYFAANKVFSSDDRGNNWTVISDDLTRQIDRNKLKVMGRVWSIDAVAKNQSTSPYGNIVTFAESPVNADLLFAGTDDGLIQITSDRGKTWRKIDKIKGAPDTSFVNMITPSSHDQNVVYACFNHHKYGDFKPYVFVSKDKGLTWTSISNNLPVRGTVYCLAEDNVDPDLLFAGTEFGLYFSNSAGKSWKKLSSGLPTISIKDMAIQKRENDLVLASFGRGFFVLDDYSPLRNIRETDLSKEAIVMPIRDAYVFENSTPYGLPGQAFQGSSFYRGDNLGAKALIAFYIRDKVVSAKDLRIKEDGKLEKANKDNVYPTYEQLAKERDEEKSKLYITISNQQGDIVRKLSMPADKQGLQRIEWDLRTSSKDPVQLGGSDFYNPFESREEGPLVAPGMYTVSLSRWKDGAMTALGTPVSFKVKPLGNIVLPPKDMNSVVVFKREAENLSRIQQSVSRAISSANSEMSYIRRAIAVMEQPEDSWLKEVISIEQKLDTLQRRLSGDPIKVQLDMNPTPSIADRIGRVVGENKYSSAEPTGTHQQSLKIAKEELSGIVSDLKNVLDNDLAQLRIKLQKAGAPYTPNVIPIFNEQ
ncbi:MAG: glycosyl hydrolase [Saprospiraceae bacterium]